jgi:hypothetical protein
MSSLLALVLAYTALRTSASMMVDSCVAQGFDPSNLSCDTCVLLQSTDYHLQCLDCCQSYKTLDSKTSRYGAAVLVHVPGQNEEVDEFVRAEMKAIQATKDGVTLHSSSQGGGMGFYSMRPSILYLFKDKLVGMTTQEYAAAAQEQIVLHGWSKDDLKDMILALLPDRK